MHSTQASIMIQAPVAECYRRWRDVEKFPEFMPRVIRVQAIQEHDREPWSALSGLAYDWEVRGPLGHSYRWTAVITQDIPDKIISWATLPSQDVATSGSANFMRQANHEDTLVEVTLAFSVPGGPGGELLSDVARYGDTVLMDSLQAFKRYVERDVREQLNPATRGDVSPAMRGEAALRQSQGVPPVVRGDSASD